jgi:integrase
MATTSPIKDKKQLRQLADYFLNLGQTRNFAMVTLCAHTALRISDILKLRWRDVYDFERNHIRNEIALTEKKTKKPKRLELHKVAVDALIKLMNSRKCPPDDFVFQSRKTDNGKPRPISRQQATRIVQEATKTLNWKVKASCHSLRKTFGYHAWKSGVSPVLIMEIYNHSSFAVTRRYLGIDQDDKNEVYAKLKMFR